MWTPPRKAARALRIPSPPRCLRSCPQSSARSSIRSTPQTPSNSTRGSGADYQSAKGYAFPYGDYMNATADGAGRVHAIWGAGASFDGPGGTWYARTQ